MMKTGKYYTVIKIRYQNLSLKMDASKKLLSIRKFSNYKLKISICMDNWLKWNNICKVRLKIMTINNMKNKLTLSTDNCKVKKKWIVTCIIKWRKKMSRWRMLKIKWKCLQVVKHNCKKNIHEIWIQLNSN